MDGQDCWRQGVEVLPQQRLQDHLRFGRIAVETTRVGLATRSLKKCNAARSFRKVLIFFTEIKDSTNTPHHFTMASIVDECAPNVSAAMRRRIAAALDKGDRPTLTGNNLKLGTIVLQR